MSKKNISVLQENKAKLEADKAKLEAIKVDQPEKWTSQMQVKLDELVGMIADVDEEIIDAASEEASTYVPEKETSAYVPEKGTEKHVHLMIVRGRRFNPITGKEESQPYKQLFTYGEFQLFKSNAHLLGYVVLKVLHDPYNEANAMVVKQ